MPWQKVFEISLHNCSFVPKAALITGFKTIRSERSPRQIVDVFNAATASNMVNDSKDVC